MADLTSLKRTYGLAGLALLAGTVLPAGATTPAPAKAPASVTQTAAPTKADAEPELPPGFETWRTGFRVRAIKEGIKPDIFDAAFKDVEPVAKVIERNDKQPEFVRPIWQYLDGAVSATRIKNGKKMLAKHGRVLARIEKEYGVSARTIVAIWGLETSYGAIMGSEDVIASLATLAYQGRRQSFGERELIAAMRIIQEGDKPRSELKGSWAGAMGHTQFIPTTFLAYAVDYDGDGRRDIWDSKADAFASTANYLKQSGWEEGFLWGREVSLPRDFDLSQIGRKRTKSLTDWAKLGVTRPGGAKLPKADIDAAVILPAGYRGPSFMIYNNFNTIMRYNNATSYALAIGHLSDRFVGKSAFRKAWPRDSRPLKRTEREEMQTLLNGLGYPVGVVDGIMGARTREAIRGFQKAQGMPADGFADSSVLNALRKASAG